MQPDRDIESPPNETGAVVVERAGWPTIVGIVRTMRPRQWVKNLFVLVPMVFAKELLDVRAVVRALVAFVAFSAASSAVYVMNDLNDVEADRAHPKKRARPIAAGVVPESAARVAGVVLAAVAIAIGFGLGVRVSVPVLGYLLLNTAYTFKLKRIPYLDVLCIAAGFEFRLHGGAFAIGVTPETYLIVVTFTLASFLGFGKRMHELRQGESAEKQRAVLGRYRVAPLTALLLVNGLATIGAYVAGTLDPRNQAYFGSNHLVYTSVFAALGIARFTRLVTHHPHAESPTEEMLEDKWFLANLVAWAVAVVAVVYDAR